MSGYVNGERIFSGLDQGLNVAVLQVASQLYPGGYAVSDVDPYSSYEDLRKQWETGKYVVYAGDSDFTIYDDGEVNMAMRAWHDHCHMRDTRNDFSFLGEVRVWHEMCRDLKTLYGNTPQVYYWCALLYADVIGQAEYLRRNGAFPKDQIGFVQAYMVDPEMALSSYFGYTYVKAA